jgi:hypothetical protein
MEGEDAMNLHPIGVMHQLLLIGASLPLFAVIGWALLSDAGAGRRAAAGAGAGEVKTAGWWEPVVDRGD